MTVRADAFARDAATRWVEKAPASEQLFFAAMPVAHIVAYEDNKRESRLDRIVAAFHRAARPARQAE